MDKASLTVVVRTALQAKVWLVLATESISEKAQLEGRQKAVDVLK